MRTWLNKWKKGVVVDNSARLTKLVVWFGTSSEFYSRYVEAGLL